MRARYTDKVDFSGLRGLYRQKFVLVKTGPDTVAFGRVPDLYRGQRAMCEIRNRRGLESLPLSKVLTDPSAVQRLTASNFKSTGVAAEMVAERFRIGIKVEGIPVAFEPFEPHSPSKLTHCFACGSTDASSKPTYRRIAVPSMEEAERLIGLLGEGATLQTNKDPHDQSDWPFHVRIEECDDHLDTRGPYPHIRTLEGFGWTYGALNRQLVEAAQQPT